MLFVMRLVKGMLNLTCGFVVLAVAAPAILWGGAVPARTPEADRASLVDAERAFARASEENGMRDAFLAFLADDAVFFRPGPVAAKEWMRSHPAPQILLSWRPSFAEVSAAGDLGYTFGPYEVRPKPAAAIQVPAAPAGAAPSPGVSGASGISGPPGPSAPAAAAGAPAGGAAPAPGPAVEYGHFVTVWKKQQDGAWRAVFDAGTENPPPPAAGAAGAVVAHGKIAGGSAAEVDVEPARRALLDADRAFARASLTRGTRAAYLDYLAADARILRDGLMPISGRAAIRKAFLASRRRELLVWEPERADVARSGDLGYTYGSSGVKEEGPRGMTSNPGHYLRIWEKEPGSGWKVVLDLLAPMPPPAPPRQPQAPGTAPP